MTAIDWIEVGKMNANIDPVFAVQCLRVAIKKLEKQVLTKEEEASETHNRR